MTSPDVPLTSLYTPRRLDPSVSPRTVDSFSSPRGDLDLDPLELDCKLLTLPWSIHSSLSPSMKVHFLCSLRFVSPSFLELNKFLEFRLLRFRGTRTPSHRSLSTLSIHRYLPQTSNRVLDFSQGLSTFVPTPTLPPHPNGTRLNSLKNSREVVDTPFTGPLVVSAPSSGSIRVRFLPPTTSAHTTSPSLRLPKYK